MEFIIPKDQIQKLKRRKAKFRHEEHNINTNIAFWRHGDGLISGRKDRIELGIDVERLYTFI